MQESSIATVDYQTMQNRTLSVIEIEIKTIEAQVTRTAVEGAIQIGLRLQEAKEKAGHGNFEQWCKDNLNYSKSKAERFMKIATNYGDENNPLSKTSTLTDFSISKALSLLALPEEEVETFVEKHNVEEMSVREMDETIKQLKREKAEAEAQADSWKLQKEQTEEALEQNENNIQELQNKITQLNAELRIKEAEQTPEVDTSEYEAKISTLEESIDKAKAEKTKLKEQLKEIKESKEKEISQAISEQKDSLYKQAKAECSAEISKANELNEQLKNENEGLKRKLQNNSAESKLRFKIIVDQLQDTFNECMGVVATEEEETATKMKTALKAVLTAMEQSI